MNQLLTWEWWVDYHLSSHVHIDGSFRFEKIKKILCLLYTRMDKTFLYNFLRVNRNFGVNNSAEKLKSTATIFNLRRIKIIDDIVPRPPYIYIHYTHFTYKYDVGYPPSNCNRKPFQHLLITNYRSLTSYFPS